MTTTIDDTLERAAAAYQAQHIIPHCSVCARPCCKLDEVVLDLDWRRAQALYQITSSRRAFDRALPAHIRAQGGRYYAHGKPCPAYDDAGKGCRVYGTDVKPPSCTDFPVYLDGDVVTADRRCEAVDIAVLQRALEAAVPGKTITSTEDAQFPVLVSFAVAEEG